MRLPFGVAGALGVARGLPAAWLINVALPASGEVRTLELTDAVLEKPVSLSCAARQTTRIVFPEQSRRLKVSAGAKEKLGMRLVATQPNAIVEVSPPSTGVAGTIEFTGASTVLTVLVTAVESERASEVRLVLPPRPAASRAPPPLLPKPTAPARSTRSSPAPSPPGPTATPVPTTPPPALTIESSPEPRDPGALSPTSSVQTHVERSPSPPTPSLSATVPTLDVSELLQLRPVVIGRREGLPGQRPLILEDALKSDTNVWLRFRLVGGSKERIGEISWEHGPLSSFLQTTEGKDLRLIVKLPRSSVSKKTRVRIRLEGEKADRSFALDSPWLSSFLRSLVQ